MYHSLYTCGKLVFNYIKEIAYFKHYQAELNLIFFNVKSRNSLLIIILYIIQQLIR